MLLWWVLVQIGLHQCGTPDFVTSTRLRVKTNVSAVAAAFGRQTSILGLFEALDVLNRPVAAQTGQMKIVGTANVRVSAHTHLVLYFFFPACTGINHSLLAFTAIAFNEPLLFSLRNF